MSTEGVSGIGAQVTFVANLVQKTRRVGSFCTDQRGAATLMTDTKAIASAGPGRWEDRQRNAVRILRIVAEIQRVPLSERVGGALAII